MKKKKLTTADERRKMFRAWLGERPVQEIVDQVNNAEGRVVLKYTTFNSAAKRGTPLSSVLLRESVAKVWPDCPLLS